MKLRAELRRFASYNAVGLVTTVVSIPLMALLDHGGMPYPFYTALNYAAGILLGFWLNFRFAFRGHGAPWPRTLVRYLATFGSLLVLVQGLQAALIEGAHWPRWVSVGAGMLVYGGLGYLLSVRWVFARL